MGNRRLRTLALVPFLLAAQCQSGPADTKPRPCELACAKLQELGCPAGDPTPAGSPCSAWMCAGGPAGANVLCIAAATSCEAAEECSDG